MIISITRVCTISRNACANPILITMPFSIFFCCATRGYNSALCIDIDISKAGLLFLILTCEGYVLLAARQLHDALLRPPHVRRFLHASGHDAELQVLVGVYSG